MLSILFCLNYDFKLNYKIKVNIKIQIINCKIAPKFYKHFISWMMKKYY